MNTNNRALSGMWIDRELIESAIIKPQDNPLSMPIKATADAITALSSRVSTLEARAAEASIRMTASSMELRDSAGRVRVRMGLFDEEASPMAAISEGVLNSVIGARAQPSSRAAFLNGTWSADGSFVPTESVEKKTSEIPLTLPPINSDWS